MIIISVGGVPWYAIVAAAGVVIVPSYLTNANTSNWLQLLFGVAAIMYAVTPPHLKGTPSAVRTALDRLVHRRVVSTGHLVTESTVVPHPDFAKVESCTLRVEDIQVAFGGLLALDGVSIEATTGRITGLIGPNGAGKTTLFNACSGLNHPSRGSILLNGTDIMHESPSRRARQGLGRTFQQMELFDSLTVWENVELGLEGSYAGSNVFRHLMSLPATKRRVRIATVEALRQCELLPLADRTAGSLSTGQRRLVELARCLAGPFRLLLLDEPSSGLDRTETARFGEILKRAVDERGIGILLVEHDMALVTNICNFIYVLDFGRPIFRGTAAEVMTSSIVQAAYLGGDESVMAASISTPIQQRSTVS